MLNFAAPYDDLVERLNKLLKNYSKIIEEGTSFYIKNPCLEIPLNIYSYNYNNDR